MLTLLFTMAFYIILLLMHLLLSGQYPVFLQLYLSVILLHVIIIAVVIVIGFVDNFA